MPFPFLYVLVWLHIIHSHWPNFHASHHINLAFTKSLEIHTLLIFLSH
ncbi:hypothetical protein GLYMA_13G025250v4 [Glycine max]|nr:hypothetical protein GLYMA_13G025250v4 [Glycine max]KAH1099501.1 hypothetical protein GYH30_034914 [Glycine max]